MYDRDKHRHHDNEKPRQTVPWIAVIYCRGIAKELCDAHIWPFPALGLRKLLEIYYWLSLMGTESRPSLIRAPATIHKINHLIGSLNKVREPHEATAGTSSPEESVPSR